jgi:hypothetical protein
MGSRCVRLRYISKGLVSSQCSKPINGVCLRMLIAIAKGAESIMSARQNLVNAPSMV